MGLEGSFSTWDILISGAFSDSRPDSPRESFKEDFDFVMFVFSFCFQVDIALSLVAKGFEKMVKHFRGHTADFLPLERGIPD